MKLVGNKIKVYIFKNKKYHKYLTKLGLENAKKDENGKPYVPGIHFSISTANKYSCIAISKRYRVGIDILEKNQKIYHYEKVLKK
jgi:phosphopantetheinyl transferase